MKGSSLKRICDVGFLFGVERPFYLGPDSGQYHKVDLLDQRHEE